MSLKIETLTVGPLATNCFLVWSGKKEAWIIDPGDSGDFLGEKILEKGLRLKAIVLTHAHFDHALAALELKINFKAALWLNKKDLFILEYMGQSAKYWLNLKNEAVAPTPEVDRFLKEGEKLRLGDEVFEVLATPGHTPGSISLYNKKEEILFSGDLLFNNGFGRTDLPGGSQKELVSSLRKVFKLPGKTRVLPGHGAETTIGEERKNLSAWLGER